MLLLMQNSRCSMRKASQVIWISLPRVSDIFFAGKNGAECTANLRVEKHHITRLEDALPIPAAFKCDQGMVCDESEGLCILLKRSGYPSRYSDMIPIFERPFPQICMINDTVMDWVFDKHGHRKSNRFECHPARKLR